MDRKSWDWLKNGFLNKGTESIIVAAQDEAFFTKSNR